MISDGYASTLKRLITFTQAKFISLADVVGYDVSYVNKWSNGTKLPSSRYVERINEEMGQYFAELITKQKKEAKFFKTFPISENTDDLGFEIGQYLCAAYRTTLNQNRVPRAKKTARPSRSSPVITIRRLSCWTCCKRAFKASKVMVSSWSSVNFVLYTKQGSGNISKASNYSTD